MPRSPRHPLLLTALLAALAASCGVAGEASTGTETVVTTEDAPASDRSGDTPPRSRKPVRVFFACGPSSADLDPFPRRVGAAASLSARLEAAMTAYFAGPRRDEGRGCTSFAGPGTLISTSVVGTRAIIDLDLDDVGSSTSAQSQHLWTVLRRHAFQFPAITGMEPRYHGSCAAFGRAVEAGECLIVLRDGTAVPGP